MESSSAVSRPDGDLRKRAPKATDDGASSKSPASKTTPSGKEQPKGDESKKTYGRTPNGTVFVVPTTHDMVSQLLDPRQPKNLSDALVLAILAAHILAAIYLPASYKRPVFAVIFLFWRASYNIGIGVLLHIQSHYRRLETWAIRWKIFENPKDGNNPRPWLYYLLKKELESKIPEDYEFEKAPLEYNTWLVFRRVVDLILMCDFTSYCLFAIVCGHTPEGEHFLVGLSRWVAGIALIGFNLWVKLDAHRVVKDFAWYWGDFFYLIDQDLTFDGVFEMAPHPMYSIGYAGYYGISMMAASYEVLFISIAAHMTQFAFLVAVENPHIEKTYNPPPPRTVETRPDISSTTLAPDGQSAIPAIEKSVPSTPTGNLTAFHDMVGFSNMDLFRVPDFAVVLMPMYITLLALATPTTPFWQALFILHAFGWRVWYHLGLGIILDKQSKTKMWTRHFLKYGESAGEAWRQWKGMYHVSMIMCNASFIAACWKMYTFPSDWGYGLVLLKHVMGTGLIALQLWTAFSVYESLGEFGWFCGDYFFDNRVKLTYTSIYRFVNNPERIFGIAGLWGAALITWSRAIFAMALATQLMTIYFLAYVERPHMQKIYGRNVREEAGLTKFIKRSLPPPVKTLQKSMDKVIDDTTQFVEEFIDTARPKFTSGVKTIVRDTSALFNVAPARLTLTQIPLDLAGLNPKNYSLSIEGQAVPTDNHATGKESLSGRFPKGIKTSCYEYGAPLKVRWTAPAKHDKKDWIGLYMVTDNRSREVTEVPSSGRWVPTIAGSYDDPKVNSAVLVDQHEIPTLDDDGNALVEGEALFAGDKLWWTQSTFEFRFHHGSHHHVLAISEPFEVRIPKFDEEDVSVDSKGMYAKAVEAAVLPMVQNCLDRNPDIAPKDIEESFGSLVERDGKYAKRVVYAIREMFGIEFAPAVVLADGNVRKLSWRICNAKEVLAPYSMSVSKGTSTPVTQTYLKD